MPFPDIFPSLAAAAAALPPPGLLALSALALFGAGLLRGFTGFGFGIAAVPLLSSMFPPEAAVPFVLLLQVLVSAEGVLGAARACDRRSVGILALSAALATPVGVLALTALPVDVVRIAIAIIVVLGAVTITSGSRPAWLASDRAAVAIGGVAGLFNGLAGMPGPLAIAYYLASPLGSARARASMVVLFLLTGLVALPPLAVAGALSPGRAALATAGFPVVWLGSWAGARLYPYSTERVYRWIGVAVLCAAAAIVCARALVARA